MSVAPHGAFVCEQKHGSPNTSLRTKAWFRKVYVCHLLKCQQLLMQPSTTQKYHFVIWDLYLPISGISLLTTHWLYSNLTQWAFIVHHVCSFIPCIQFYVATIQSLSRTPSNSPSQSTLNVALVGLRSICYTVTT